MSSECVRNGYTKGRQRFRCQKCRYNFSVDKMGKGLGSSYQILAFHLFLEGMSLRETARLIGVSHTTVRNWIDMVAPGLKVLRKKRRGVVEEVKRLDILMQQDFECPAILVALHPGKVIRFTSSLGNQ